MRSMRMVLASVYIILIILILLTHCSDRSNTVEPAESVEPTESVEPVGPSELADSSEVRRIEEIGGTGDLKITLLWNFHSDIDLHVQEPDGYEISYKNKTSPSGGKLDTDNRSGGRGSAENIYWEAPPTGQYKIWLEYYASSQTSPVGGTCEVYVKRKGRPTLKYTVELTTVKQKKNIATIDI